MVYHEEIKRMSELYNVAYEPEAKKCYDQYVELLIVDLNKEEQESLRGLWRKLIGWER